jgi:hypothetical protein
MKKLKLIGAVSAISVLGLGGLAIPTTLASCSQNNHPTPTTDKTLNIEGMRDLAVPYKNTYKYECKNGTLSIDGDLPTGFKFQNNTLTYTSQTAPTTSGSFKLKATANDGSGRTKTITITYYGVYSISADSCRFLYTDGSISTNQTFAISSGSLILHPSDNDKKILKAVYFGTLSGVTSIGSYFLSDCTALTTVDLTQFGSVTTIGSDFLSDCTALTTVDLTQFGSVASIGNNFLFRCSSLASITLPSSLKTIGSKFLSNCTSLTSINLSGLTNLTSIGSDFLYQCSTLASIDFSHCINLTSIGDYFLSYCSSLTSIDLSGLTALTTIGNYFLSHCYALISIDFSHCTNLKTIGNYFLSHCSALSSINLSGLTALSSIGSYFLSDCTALTSVTVSDNDFSRNTLSIGNYPMDGVTNITANTIHGSKAKEFRSAIGTAISV